MGCRTSGGHHLVAPRQHRACENLDIRVAGIHPNPLHRPICLYTAIVLSGYRYDVISLSMIQSDGDGGRSHSAIAIVLVIHHRVVEASSPEDCTLDPVELQQQLWCWWIGPYSVGLPLGYVNGDI